MAHPFGYTAAETLTGNKTLTVADIADSNMLSFDCGGSARSLTLPAEASCAGVVLFISNTSDDTEVLTIQDDTPATVCTPTQNEDAIVWCNGTSWYGGTLAAS